MNRKCLAAVFTVLALGIGSPSARTQMGPLPGPPGPPPPIGMLLMGVSLTAEQQAEVKAIMKAHRQLVEPLHQLLDTQHEQLMSKLVAPGPVTLADLAALEQEGDQTEQRLRQEMLKAAVEVRAVLTPDQLAKAAANQQKLAQIHGEMRGLMAPPPDAP